MARAALRRVPLSGADPSVSPRGHAGIVIPTTCPTIPPAEYTECIFRNLGNTARLYPSLAPMSDEHMRYEVVACGSDCTNLCVCLEDVFTLPNLTSRVLRPHADRFFSVPVCCERGLSNEIQSRVVSDGSTVSQW